MLPSEWNGTRGAGSPRQVRSEKRNLLSGTRGAISGQGLSYAIQSFPKQSLVWNSQSNKEKDKLFVYLGSHIFQIEMQASQIGSSRPLWRRHLVRGSLAACSAYIPSASAVSSYSCQLRHRTLPTGQLSRVSCHYQQTISLNKPRIRVR